MQDCWDATTDVFASYCGGDAPPLAPTATRPPTTAPRPVPPAPTTPCRTPPSKKPSKAPTSWSTWPRRRTSKACSTCPARSTIRATRPGLAIETELCFHNLVNNGTDINIDYCEYGVPGIVAPITGEGQDFTMYFVYPQQATVCSAAPCPTTAPTERRRSARGVPHHRHLGKTDQLEPRRSLRRLGYTP